MLNLWRGFRGSASSLSPPRPLSAAGHVNLSPKGGEAFRVLGPMEVAYHDYTGSGAETAAHLRENGRIAIMFCAFEGAPKILRLHGRGVAITPVDPRFAELVSHFPANPGTRAFVHVTVTRVIDLLWIRRAAV